MFASLVLLMAAAKKKKKKPIKTGASSGHITNLKQSILETFDNYGCSIVGKGKMPLFRVTLFAISYVRGLD